MEPLLQLAARCETAKEPDRALDGAIAVAIGLAEADLIVSAVSVTGFLCGDGRGGYGTPSIARYTGSVDAALTLVPEGHWAEGTLSRPAAIDVHEPMSYDPIGKGWAATPALAIAAAALRTRAAIETAP